MKRSVTLLAMMLWLGLGCSAALADIDLELIGDVIEGNSFTQLFGVRAGNWAEFGTMEIDITSSHYWAVTPLSGFAEAGSVPPGNNAPLPPGTAVNWSWALGAGSQPKEVLATAVSSSDYIGDTGNWLLFRATFEPGPAPPGKGDEWVEFNMFLTTSDGLWVYSRCYNYYVDGGRHSATLQSFPCSAGPVLIPAPAAIGLGMLGLGLIGWYMRRFA